MVWKRLGLGRVISCVNIILIIGNNEVLALDVRVRRYDQKLKSEIIKLIVHQKLSIPIVSSNTGIPKQTLYNWVNQYKCQKTQNDKIKQMKLRISDLEKESEIQKEMIRTLMYCKDKIKNDKNLTRNYVILFLTS